MLQAEDDDDDNAHTDQNDSAYNDYDVLYIMFNRFFIEIEEIQFQSE